MPDPFNSESFKSSNKEASPASFGEANSAAPQTIAVLQNRYALIHPLGQGGMGTVFLAQDRRLSNRFCVVKKLRLDGFDSEDKRQAMEFFEREAMVLSSLKHPNVVAIQDYFEEQGNYFLAMEYVEGDDLHQLLKKRSVPFSEKQVIDWAITILGVLRYLHSHQPPVIYRDIKPSNIMISTTLGIKLVDFGIARPYAENSENTHVVSGGYSPPEQYWGAADTRSDIYALGATMYYLLTGKEPIALQNCAPKRRNAKVSEYLDKVIQRATAQDVWLRYQTAADMHQALSEMPQRRFLSQPPAYVLIAGALALISVAAAVFVFLTFNGAHRYQHSVDSLIGESKISTVDVKEVKSKANGWPLPLELSSLADSEEIITDPNGLKPAQPQKNNWFK